jgi:hypothetical protein
MIAFVALFLFLVAYGAMREFSRAASGRPAEARLYTFFVDPLLPCLLVGFLIARLSLITKKGAKLGYESFRKRKRVVSIMLWSLFLLWVVGAEVPAYFNLIPHPFDHARTGNDFMWNGYIEWLFGGPVFDTTVPTYKSLGMNLLAVALLGVQAGCVWFGCQLAYMTAFFDDKDRWARPKPK